MGWKGCFYTNEEDKVMPKLSDLDPGKFAKILFVGRHGSGKTTALKGFPRPMRIHDFDRRLLPLKMMYPEMGVEGIDFESYDPEEWPKFDRELSHDISYPPMTLVVDSLSFMADSCIDYLLTLRGVAGRTKNTKYDKVDMGVIEIPEMGEWLGEARGLSKVLALLRKAPCHFILTAHITSVTKKNIRTNEETTEHSVITGGSKIAAKVGGYFNEVWYFEAKPIPSGGAEYKVYTQPVDACEFAKTAWGLPAEINITHPRSLFEEVDLILKEKGIILEREPIKEVSEEDRKQLIDEMNNETKTF